MNFLEQITAEYYGLKGYWVRVREPLPRDHCRRGDLDVLAYDAKTDQLLHIELGGNGDAANLKKLKESKFESDTFYRRHFQCERVVRIAVSGWGREKSAPRAKEYQQHDICLMSVGELMTKIRSYIESDWWPPTQRAIPEQYPILRGIQETLRYTWNRR